MASEEVASLRTKTALAFAMIGALALVLGAFAYPALAGSHILPSFANGNPPQKAVHPTNGDDNGTANTTEHENDTSEPSDANETETGDNETSDASEPSDANETADANDTSDMNDTTDVSSMTVLSIVPELAIASVPQGSSALVVLAPAEQVVSVLISWTMAVAPVSMGLISTGR